MSNMKLKPFALFVLNELSLSPKTLNKLDRNTQNLRGDKFVEKYKNGDPFETMKGDRVVLKIDNDVLSALEKMRQDNNYSGVSKLNFEDESGNIYKLSSLKKNEEFGSSKGSGGGSDATTIYESLQCWYCAAAMKTHGRLTSESYSKALSKIKNDIDTPEFSDPTMELSQDWLFTMLNAANLIKSHLGNKSYTFHRGSTFVKKINAAFKIANKNSGSPFSDMDKWNPADIWVVQKSKQNAIEQRINDKELTLETLNTIIFNLFIEKDLIGISLKKMSTKGGAHIVLFNDHNDEHISKIEFDKNTPVYVSNKENIAASKDVYALVIKDSKDVFKIQFRTFGDGVGDWQAEIKGGDAAAGKIGGGPIAKIFKRSFDEYLYLEAVKSMAFGEIVSEIYKLNNDIKLASNKSKDDTIKLFADKVKEFGLQYAQSKLLGLRVASAIKESLAKNDGKAEKFINSMFMYMYSSTDDSSVFYKVY